MDKHLKHLDERKVVKANTKFQKSYHINQISELKKQKINLSLIQHAIGHYLIQRNIRVAVALDNADDGNVIVV